MNEETARAAIPVEARGPIAQFLDWYDEAKAAHGYWADVMALATVASDGAPSVRMVLLKGVEDGNFVFYTNLESRKAKEIAREARVAACFHWHGPKRQVRIEGRTVPLAPAQADAYFATRPRGSQIAAWASSQSRALADREELSQRVAEAEARFSGGAVPRPPFWSGYAIVPQTIEFWQDMPYRLHDRLLYERAGEAWRSVRLQP